MKSLLARQQTVGQEPIYELGQHKTYRLRLAGQQRRKRYYADEEKQHSSYGYYAIWVSQERQNTQGEKHKDTPSRQGRPEFWFVEKVLVIEKRRDALDIYNIQANAVDARRK